MQKTVLHPGEILLALLLEEGLSVEEFCARYGASVFRIKEILSGRRAVSYGVANALGHFKHGRIFWLRAQKSYDEINQKASPRLKTRLPLRMAQSAA